MTKVVLGLALAAVLAAVAAGCGGSGGHRAAATTTRPAASLASCREARKAAARATARLRRDVVAIRRAADTPTRDTFLGNAAVNAATDRFLLDVARAPVDQLARNRFIDHAASALVGSCEQCFQALEAARPIPAIAHSGPCG